MPEPKSKPARLRRVVMRLVLVVLAALLTRMFLFDVYPVREESMWQALEGEDDRDYVGVDKTAAWRTDPGRFELWVFRHNEAFRVKRVMALGSETVDFRAGDLWIAGAANGGALARVTRPAGLIEAQMVRVPADPARTLAFEARDGRVEREGDSFTLVPDAGRTAVAIAMGGPGENPSCIKDDYKAPHGYVRGRHAVPDLRITLEGIGGEAQAFAVVHELGKKHLVRVSWDASGLLVAGDNAGTRSDIARFPELPRPDALRLQTLDGMFTVQRLVEGGWRDLCSQPRDTDTPEGHSGVSIEARGGALTVRSLSVARDVHYFWGGEHPPGPQTIAPRAIFLVGDNPGISIDSRDVNFGTITYEDLVGRVRLRVWPPRRFGAAR